MDTLVELGQAPLYSGWTGKFIASFDKICFCTNIYNALYWMVWFAGLFWVFANGVTYSCLIW